MAWEIAKRLPQDEKTVAPCQAVERSKIPISATKHFWGALVGGPAVSVLLYCLSSPKTEFLAYPQIVGWLACILLRGIHTASVMDFVLIAVPINAAIYTLVIFLLLRKFGRSNPK
jgi:hypothetical protein